MRILLSRTDSIGDVMLTLPMAGILKKLVPGVTLHFLGSNYTKSVVECCEHIDQFIDWNELSSLGEKEAIEKIRSENYDVCIHVFPVKKIANLIKKSGISLRIGTSGRLYHYLTCNKIIHFSRKRSSLHEAQLNLKLLKGLGFNTQFSLDVLPNYYGFTKLPESTDKIQSFLKKDKVNLILHPKSKGSAIEWGLENFSKLIDELPGNYHVYISGTEADTEKIGTELPFDRENVTSILGVFSLSEFITFISLCDGLVAASTGPLHIAAALNKVAMGLYSSRKPIHPGRWQPIGKSAKALVFDENCETCAAGKACNCIKDISAQTVIQSLELAFKDRF